MLPALANRTCFVGFQTRRRPKYGKVLFNPMVDTGLPPNIALPPIGATKATDHEGRTARRLSPPAQSQHQSRSLAPKITSRPATRPAKLLIREAELHKASLHWPPCITTKIVGLAGRGKGGGDPLAVLNHDDQDEEHEVAGPCQMVTKATFIPGTTLNRPNSSRLGIHKQHLRPEVNVLHEGVLPLQAVNHNHTREQLLKITHLDGPQCDMSARVSTD